MVTRKWRFGHCDSCVPNECCPAGVESNGASEEPRASWDVSKIVKVPTATEDDLVGFGITKGEHRQQDARSRELLAVSLTQEASCCHYLSSSYLRGRSLFRLPRMTLPRYQEVRILRETRNLGCSGKIRASEEPYSYQPDLCSKCFAKPVVDSTDLKEAMHIVLMRVRVYFQQEINP